MFMDMRLNEGSWWYFQEEDVNTRQIRAKNCCVLVSSIDEKHLSVLFFQEIKRKDLPIELFVSDVTLQRLNKNPINFKNLRAQL